MTHVRDRLGRQASIHCGNGYLWYDPIFNFALIRSNGRSKHGNPSHFYFVQIRYMNPSLKSAIAAQMGTTNKAYQTQKCRVTGVEPIAALHRSRKVETIYRQIYAQEFAQYMAEG